MRMEEVLKANIVLLSASAAEVLGAAPVPKPARQSMTDSRNIPTASSPRNTLTWWPSSAACASDEKPERRTAGVLR